MKLYKKYTEKNINFFVVDTTFLSDNLLCFSENLLEEL